MPSPACVQLKWSLLRVKLSLLGEAELGSEEARTSARVRYGGLPPLTRKEVLGEIKERAPPAFLDAHMADVQSWSLAAAAKQLPKQRIVELCVSLLRLRHPPPPPNRLRLLLLSRPVLSFRARTGAALRVSLRQVRAIAGSPGGRGGGCRRRRRRLR